MFTANVPSLIVVIDFPSTFAFIVPSAATPPPVELPPSSLLQDPNDNANTNKEIFANCLIFFHNV